MSDSSHIVIRSGDLPRLDGIAPADAEAKARIAGSDLALQIPFGQIDMAEDNVRDAAATDYRPLADSIRRTGLVQAISVEPNPHEEGRWVVTDGHRRFLAIAALGLKADDAVQVTPLTTTTDDPVSRTLRMVAANTHRADMSAMDEARVIARLTGLYDMSHVDVAEAMGGWNRKTVALRLALLELPAEAQQDVHDGTLPVEGAQEIGRLIRDGAPQSTTDRLIKQRANYHAVQSEWKRWRGTKAVEAFTAQAEARGFMVVANIRHVPVRSGYEPVTRDLIEVDSAKAVKGLDPAKVKTLKEPTGDKRPILLIQRGFESDAQVWSVRSQKKAEHVSPGSGMDGWRAERAARDVLVETRSRRAAELVHGEGGDLGNLDALRMAASISLGHFPNHRAEQLALLAGMALVADEPASEGMRRRVLWPQTVNAWLDEANTIAKLKRLLWAIALTESAVLLGDYDGTDGGLPDSALPHVRAGVEAGIGEPLTADALAKVQAHVKARLEAGADPVEEVTDADAEPVVTDPALAPPEQYEGHDADEPASDEEE